MRCQKLGEGRRRHNDENTHRVGGKDGLVERDSAKHDCVGCCHIAILAAPAHAGVEWPETCDEEETWTDEETGDLCRGTGTIFNIGGRDYCAADCDGESKLFSLGES